MTELGTASQIQAAIDDNDAQPFGSARSSRAEEIAAAADALDDPIALTRALSALINAYEFGAEQAKMPVPFARLLRHFDEHPDAFTEWQVHNLQWYFKWITLALIQVPDAPLASITGWIREMERRYQAAGHSMRTIASVELTLALHIGDLPQVEQARLRMLSLPRDQMSDCPACEAEELGRTHLAAGRDDAALRSWAMVLAGYLRCNEEPHRTLAVSLLPLLRVGRPDDAGSNHRRGYHLARGNANLAVAIGRHMEFCALTGNAGRGLTILAENAALIASVTDPLARLQFLTGVVVLLRAASMTGRDAVLAGLGTVDQLIGQITPEITDLAARFDARNGTSALSDEMTVRLNQEPLASGLIVEVTAPVSPGQHGGGSAGSSSQHGDADDAAEADLGQLVARARALSEVSHPGANAAWDRVIALTSGAPAEAESGAARELLAGEIAEHLAFGATSGEDWRAAVAGLRAAAGHYEAAGRPGKALAARTRALWAAAMGDPRLDVWPEFDTQLARARELVSDGTAEPASLLTVRQARVLTALNAMDGGHGSALAAREIEALIADAREHGVGAGEARGEMLAAILAHHTGDSSAQIAALRRAVSLFQLAERPWLTAQLNAQLADALLAQDDPAAAAEAAEEAIAIARQWPDESLHLGAVYMMANRAYRGMGQARQALNTSRAALSWFERSGDELATAQVRADYALDLAATAQPQAAISALETAIGDLIRLAGDAAAAGPRMLLGQVLRQSGDHAAAAATFILAAQAREQGTDRHLYLESCAQAALSLADGGQWDAAVKAYDEALALAGELLAWRAVVAMRRQLAQVAVRDGAPDGPARAVRHIEAALTAGERAAGEAGGFDLVRERGISCHEAGRALVHAEQHEEALWWLDRACEDLARDDSSVGDLAVSEHLAATVEGAKLGRAGAARDRLAVVIERCSRLGHHQAAAALAKLAGELAG